MKPELKELRKRNLEYTGRDLKKALSSPDMRIVQAASALDELEEHLNVESERLREWYSIYYPEASGRIRQNETFAKVAASAKKRSDFKDVPRESIGTELGEEDMSILRKIAASIDSTYELQERLEKYLGELMKKNYPNLRAVAGDLIGAKLLARAGNGKRLARMPSSTIQVLGAEKALFRHLKTGAKPPKYGILAQHNLIQNARKIEKGKVARTLAAVISIAIKVDAYGGEFQGDMLKERLDRKIRKIQEKTRGEKK